MTIRSSFTLGATIAVAAMTTSSTDELVAMASVAAEYGGIYITHQRSEGKLIFESLDEVFEIAERAALSYPSTRIPPPGRRMDRSPRRSPTRVPGEPFPAFSASM